MCRTISIVLMLAFAVTAGCDEDLSSAGASRQPRGNQVIGSEYVTLRVQAVQRYAGTPVAPVQSPDELVGAWEMRFGGPIGSDRVQGVYEFQPDGTVAFGDEAGRWKLNGDGTLSLFVTELPDPTNPGLEQGGTVEELRYAFKAADGRIVLSNDDTSVIQLLTRKTAGSAL